MKKRNFRGVYKQEIKTTTAKAIATTQTHFPQLKNKDNNNNNNDDEK